MNLPFKIKEREKKFLVIGGIVSLFIIIFHVFSLYSDYKKKIEDFLDAKYFRLEKQLSRMAEKNDTQKRYNAIKKELEKQEKAFLRGDKPPIAAAALQKLLKEKVSSLNINVKLERALNPVDAKFYLGIPVEIGFTASTNKLSDLLLGLRKSPFLLTVSEMKIRVTNISNPMDVYATLVVTGFIKKPDEKSKKELKNVT
jgi:Tfp pilus assembly protein PilN